MVAATDTGKTEGWSSRTAFVLAAIGSAVGLGNLWRFPAEAGANGGGAFVIFYILCVVLIGLPILLSETLIGRHGRSSAVESAKIVARQSGASEHWSLLATIGMLGSFMILSFYSVIAGWVLYYVGVFAIDFFGSLSDPVAGAFAGQTAEEITALLPSLFANNPLMLSLHAGFMLVTLLAVSRGITGGIEKVAVWLMPIFFALFLGITIYGALTADFGAALSFMFDFEPARLLKGDVMLSALGQAFFSLSLGSALMITYGAYADKTVNLAKTSTTIAFADTAVAIIAGLAIFPIVFTAMAPAESVAVLAGTSPPPGGPTLMFQTLPASFQAMPAGSFIGLLFFIMVFFAALTSSVALLEAPTSWVIHKFGMARSKAAVIVAVLAFAIGIPSALSFNVLETVFPLDFGMLAGQNYFGVIDGISGKILLPLSGLLTAVFIGWFADRRLTDSENGLDGAMHLIWRFLIAWLCPTAVAAILIVGIFLS